MSDGKEVCQTDRSSTAYQGGQAVNIIIGDRFGKWLLAAIVVLTVLIATMGMMANRAELKANQAIKTSEDSQTENRLTQLWMMKVANYCTKDGTQFPAMPASIRH